MITVCLGGSCFTEKQKKYELTSRQVKQYYPKISYMWLRVTLSLRCIRSVRSVNIPLCQTHIAAIYRWLVSLIWVNAGFIPADRWNDAQTYVSSHGFHHRWCSYFRAETLLCRTRTLSYVLDIFYRWLSWPKAFPCHYGAVYRKTYSDC